MATLLESLPTSERLRQGKSVIPSILELHTLGVALHDDHFMGDLFKGGAAPGIYQSTASGTAAATAAISTGAANGAILLDAGSDDNGRSDLSLGLHFYGQNNAHFWWKAQLSAITSHKFELGATDVVSGTDAGAVNVKASNSFNATDAVVLCVDADDAATLSLCGVAAGTAATQIDFTTTLAAATYYYFGIELRDGDAKGYLLNAAGKLLEETAWMPDAVSSDVLLTPWAFVQNRSANQRTMTIDRVLAYQRETTD